MAAEAGFFSVLVSYWAGNSFPMAATSKYIHSYIPDDMTGLTTY